MRTRIKFCGCTSARDVETAVELGVDAVGVIFAASPRSVSAQHAGDIARAAPAFVSLVGVLVEPGAAQVAAALAEGFVPQFSGNEPAAACETWTSGPYIKVFHIPADGTDVIGGTDFARSAAAYTRATWMFDTAVDGKHGGTGRSFDWETVRELARDRPIIISGGLTAENVGACVRHVRPYGVDVRSGIETAGVKDVVKMRAFVRAVKEADEQA